MSRRRQPDRLDAVVAAALRVFARVGFKRAQMADIAREADVSPGTLYNYVESKEALMLLCVRQAFAADPPAAEDLPIPAPAWGETVSAIEQGLERFASLPSLEKALAAERVPRDVTAEIRIIVGELYDMVAATQRGASALERSARDLPELANVYFAGARKRLLGQLTTYIEDRVRRERIPTVPDVAAAARFVAEAVTWFARHRHGDPDSTDVPDDVVARETAIELVVRALTTGGAA